MELQILIMKPAFKFFIGVLLFGLMSCERDITLDIVQPEQQIVVEGIVENGRQVSVILSKNLPFIGVIDTAALTPYFVNNAEVTVECDNKIYTLRQIDPSFPFYFSPELFGEIGKVYNLKVVVENKVITATTRILQPIALDSIFTEEVENRPGFYRLSVTLNDPPILGNYYRAMTKLAAQQNYDTDFQSVYDDNLVNGKKFDFSINNGKGNLSDTTDFETYGFFKKGDTVDLRWSVITKDHFDFWRTVERQGSSAGNPFSAPLKIKSNINGGIGIWGSYANANYRVIVGGS